MALAGLASVLDFRVKERSGGNKRYAVTARGTSKQPAASSQQQVENRKQKAEHTITNRES